MANTPETERRIKDVERFNWIEKGSPLEKVWVTSGSDVYVARAPVGTKRSSAKWQCYKYAVSGSTTTKRFAENSTDFKFRATDVLTLTYPDLTGP